MIKIEPIYICRFVVLLHILLLLEQVFGCRRKREGAYRAMFVFIENEREREREGIGERKREIN